MTKFSRGGRAGCEDLDVAFTLRHPVRLAPTALSTNTF